MTTNASLALVIVGMALLTYVTRVGGVLLMGFVPLTPRVERFLRHLSSSVLVALLAPAAFHGDLATQVTIGVAAAAMVVTRSAIASMTVGIAVAVAIRHAVLV